MRRYLKELGVHYERVFVDMEKKEHKEDWYTKVCHTSVQCSAALYFVNNGYAQELDCFVQTVLQVFRGHPHLSRAIKPGNWPQHASHGHMWSCRFTRWASSQPCRTASLRWCACSKT